VVRRSHNARGCDAEGETLEHYCINSQKRDHPPAAMADLYENGMQGAPHKIEVYASGSRHSNMVGDLVRHLAQVCPT
jgi:hypothetical protein